MIRHQICELRYTALIMALMVCMCDKPKKPSDESALVPAPAKSETKVPPVPAPGVTKSSPAPMPVETIPPIAPPPIITPDEPSTPTKATQKQTDKSPPSKQNPRLMCEQDADCVLVTRPCTCPPCGDIWKEALNRKAYAALETSWAQRRCKQPTCPACEGRSLGTKAVCVASQCQVR